MEIGGGGWTDGRLFLVVGLLNRDGMVFIDLNRAFVSEMNAGSGYEAMILQSVANTFGVYYGVDRVLLTIGNKLYESGHIALKKGDI